MNQVNPGAHEVPFVQLLTPDGRRVPDPEHSYGGDRADIEALYRDLVMTRRVDIEAFALQRHGELGLWPPALGQEAAQVGSARALRAHDYAFPTYRDHGVAWCRGVDPSLLLGVYRGTDLGGWDPADHQLALPNIIIGAQTLHATGYAMGLTLEGLVGTGDPERDSAVIAYFGDGATSEGDVSEALDWSAAAQSHVPIVQRAAGFGLPGVRVDGNDVLAVHAVTERALQRARDGQGPTLIEAVTYRMGAHTTSDDPSRYRDAAEVADWKTKDPIDRVRLLLEAEGTSPEFFADLVAEADALGVHLREACQQLREPDLAELFDHVFVENTVENEDQKAEYVAWRTSIEGSVPA